MADIDSILESWPGIREDLKGFLSDTDAWIIIELKKAHENKDWEQIEKIIGLMDMVHNLSHGH